MSGWTNQVELPAARAWRWLFRVHVGWTQLRCTRFDFLGGFSFHNWDPNSPNTMYALCLTSLRLCVCAPCDTSLYVYLPLIFSVKFIVISRSYCGGVPLGDIGTRRFCSPVTWCFHLGMLTNSQCMGLCRTAQSCKAVCIAGGHESARLRQTIRLGFLLFAWAAHSDFLPVVTLILTPGRCCTRRSSSGAQRPLWWKFFWCFFFCQWGAGGTGGGVDLQSYMVWVPVQCHFLQPATATPLGHVFSSTAPQHCYEWKIVCVKSWPYFFFSLLLWVCPSKQSKKKKFMVLRVTFAAEAFRRYFSHEPLSARVAKPKRPQRSRQSCKDWWPPMREHLSNKSTI